MKEKDGRYSDGEDAYLPKDVPVKKKGELPVIPVDDRAAEVRAIKVS